MSKNVTNLEDKNRKVFYDPMTNRFFGVIRVYPRTVLTTGLHGFYDTAKTGDTGRYSLPKSYLKKCSEILNSDNPLSEIDNVTHSYKIKGYNCLKDKSPDNPMFKHNPYRSKIAQYRWDKKNDFWAFEKALMADRFFDETDDDYTNPDQQTLDNDFSGVLKD